MAKARKLPFLINPDINVGVNQTLNHWALAKIKYLSD
jgi:hypothetical protein